MEIKTLERDLPGKNTADVPFPIRKRARLVQQADWSS